MRKIGPLVPHRISSMGAFLSATQTSRHVLNDRVDSVVFAEWWSATNNSNIVDFMDDVPVPTPAPVLAPKEEEYDSLGESLASDDDVGADGEDSMNYRVFD
jgi:hypothetical protein